MRCGRGAAQRMHIHSVFIRKVRRDVPVPGFFRGGLARRAQHHAVEQSLPVQPCTFEELTVFLERLLPHLTYEGIMETCRIAERREAACHELELILHIFVFGKRATGFQKSITRALDFISGNKRDNRIAIDSEIVEMMIHGGSVFLMVREMTKHECSKVTMTDYFAQKNASINWTVKINICFS